MEFITYCKYIVKYLDNNGDIDYQDKVRALKLSLRRVSQGLQRKP
jgi:hypothetical protein